VSIPVEIAAAPWDEGEVRSRWEGYERIIRMGEVPDRTGPNRRPNRRAPTRAPGLAMSAPLEYRPPMASDEPRGFSLDIDKILKDVTGTRRRSTRSRSSSSNDMDAALRRAVRVELADVERSLKLLADEIVRLRRANEALATAVAKLAKR
jgi:hypothetical protein